MSWFKDKHLWAAVVGGTLLRAVPLIRWGNVMCVRDECTYLRLAERMAHGEGMTTSAGWLWAPGYPAVMALHQLLTGFASTVKGTNLVAASVSTVLLYLLARREVGRPGARAAAWLYALSPHMAFFAVQMWSETLYGMLLLGTLLVFRRTREALGPDEDGRGAWKRAVWLGVLIGGCVLFRGVATYMLPIFLAGLLWRRIRSKRAWAQVLITVVLAVATVAPYSAYASHKFHAFVVSDRTLGQMMWLGDNDFPPITFDYGNGQLSRRAFARTRKRGRPPCAPRIDALVRDSCQVREGIQWIEEHPVEFIARMPLRVAQMLNPHSLLTRHLRWHEWLGIPWWLTETIVLWGALSSIFVMWGGTVALAARGRNGTGFVVTGILLYHLAAIAALAGLSRYRVPLEPLLMAYAGVWFTDRKSVARALTEERWRLVVAVVALGALVPLVLWFLPAGWPWWRSW